MHLRSSHQNTIGEVGGGKKGRKKRMSGEILFITATKGFSSVELKEREALLTRKEILDKKRLKEVKYNVFLWLTRMTSMQATRSNEVGTAFHQHSKSNLKPSFHLQSNRWKSLH